MDSFSSSKANSTFSSDYSEPVLKGKKYYTYVSITILWASINFLFWFWWIGYASQGDLVIFVIISAILLFQYTAPQLWFILVTARMRHQKPNIAPPDKRVIMATSFVPGSESIDIIEQTLRGMMQQTYPHDIWVCDEGFIPEEAHKLRSLVQTLDDELADSLGASRTRAYIDNYNESYDKIDNSFLNLKQKPINIRYFCRHKVEKYQLSSPPFQQRTKSGNYNSLLNYVLEVLCIPYDIICQFDTDHVAEKGYLESVLAPFHNKSIAYVAAPSMNVKSITNSWAAKARWNMDSPFHGMMQMGYAAFNMPIIMGSHVTYSLPKLMAIGGFQESRADDLMHTLVFCQREHIAGCHQGAFCQNATAQGYGPNSLLDSINQETIWSQAVARIFFGDFIGKLSQSLPWSKKIALTIHQLFYVITALPYFLLFLYILLSLLFNLSGPPISVIEFSWRFILLSLAMMPFVYFGKIHGLLRPQNSRPLLLKYALLEVIRWPWYLIGFAKGLVSAITRSSSVYQVTPKNTQDNLSSFSSKIFFPHIVIIATCILALTTHMVIYKDNINYIAINFAISVNILYSFIYFFATINDIAGNKNRQWDSLLNRCRKRFLSLFQALAAITINILAIVYISSV